MAINLTFGILQRHSDYATAGCDRLESQINVCGKQGFTVYYIIMSIEKLI